MSGELANGYISFLFRQGVNSVEFTSIEEKVIYHKLTKNDASVPSPLYKADVGSNLDLGDVSQLQEKIISHLNTMESTRHSGSYRVILSERKFVGAFVIFVKKIIRKLCFWYIEPICHQQTAFNDAVTPAIGSMTEINAALINQIHQLELNYQDALTKSQDALAKANEEYLTRHHQLQNDLNKSNEEISKIQDKFAMLNRFELDVFSDYKTPPQHLSWDRRQQIGTFSQAGEDMAMYFLLMGLGVPFNTVTYLDLGANHAKFLSNTFFFYKHGIRGVLVEANPLLIPELKLYRSEDIVINRCISQNNDETVDFYVLNGDGLSTPNKKSVEEFIQKNPTLKIERVVPVETITVEKLFETYFEGAPTILNLDIEGNEMEILNSIDFIKYRPFTIIIEMIPYMMPFKVVEKNQEILNFMVKHDYHEYAFTGINSIFICKKQLKAMGRFSV